MPNIVIEDGAEQGATGAVIAGPTAYNASQPNGDTPSYLVVPLPMPAY
jgi:hypothetical protein